jgi:DinB superfamily
MAQPQVVSAVMKGPPEVTDSPWTGADIVAGLRRVHAESDGYWRVAYPDDAAFFRRIAPEVWAPADQVRHLTKSCRAIAKGFEIPRPLVALRFGVPLRKSRDYRTMVDVYQQRLRRGIRQNPFAPRVLEPHEQTKEGRARTMREHAETIDRLCRAIERYPEWSLDRLRVRHPALGMITMRELGLFALLHNVHHVQIAEERRVNPAVRTEDRR